MKISAELKSTIEAAISECNTHIVRLQSSQNLAREFFPLNVEKIQSLNEQEVMCLDQMVYRFTKLQDVLGARLFPALATLLEPTNEERPLIDALNILEKNKILGSTALWFELRSLRNRLTHEYPDIPDYTLETLTILFNSVVNLINISENAKLACKKYL